MECIPQAISLNSKVIPKHIVYQVATNHLQRVISFLGIKSLWRKKIQHKYVIKTHCSYSEEETVQYEKQSPDVRLTEP